MVKVKELDRRCDHFIQITHSFYAIMFLWLKWLLEQVLIGKTCIVTDMVKPNDNWLNWQIKHMFIHKENIDFEVSNNP